MAAWRLCSRWSAEAIKARLDEARTARLNFDAVEDTMTAEGGWHHCYSEAMIATEANGDDRFTRARIALVNYQFSDPAIVVAHFDPEEPFLGRRMLLEIQAIGLRYLCPAVVSRVRDEP